jgi:hypothetical protein
MQGLVRINIHAYLLADIVVEIPAIDLAVEARAVRRWFEGGSESVGVQSLRLLSSGCRVLQYPPKTQCACMLPLHVYLVAMAYHGTCVLNTYT